MLFGEQSALTSHPQRGVPRVVDRFPTANERHDDPRLPRNPCLRLRACSASVCDGHLRNLLRLEGKDRQNGR